MRKLLSYAKSHIYEIHAIIAATIVVVLMFFVKGPIKRKVVLIVDKKIEEQPGLLERRDIMIRRGNMVLIVLVLCLSVLIFALLAVCSPFIAFSLPSAVLSGVFALCEYAFLDQITFDSPEETESN